MVVQAYDVDVEKEYAIRGNSVVLKCKVPSFVGDFVTVTMWEDNEGNSFYPSNDYGTSFFWELKCVLEMCGCSYPSPTSQHLFSVKTLISNIIFSVVIQEYQAEAHNVYAIRGNSVVVKCEVPSFVADFVSVIGWVDSDNNNYDPTSEYGKCTIVLIMKQV